MTLVDTHLIHPNAAHVAKVRLRIGRIHLPEKHAPQPGVGFAHDLAYFTDGHLPHEQQAKGFKLFGEVRAQPLPGRTHSKDMAALTALAARQSAGDLAMVLEDIEMPPSHHFDVVVAKG